MSSIKKVVKKPFKKVLKPIAPVLMVAVVVAMAMVGLFMSTGWLEYVPSVTVPLVGWTIGPLQVVFIGTMLVCIVVGGCYLLYRNNRERIIAHWKGYSTWAKSMILGAVSAIFGGLGLGIGYALDWVTIPELALGVLITWPVVVGLVLLGYRRSDRASSGFGAITTAYVLTRGLETRTVSAIVGLLTAITGGLLLRLAGLWYFGQWPLWMSVLCGTIIWTLVTVLMYNYYEKVTAERTQLTILELSTPESRDVQEITIKNLSGDSLHLAEALIQDTNLDLYRPEFDFTLKPGARGTFEIENGFALEPNDDAIELPLGYDLKQGGETPAIYTRDGEVHYLQWTDAPAEKIDRESSKHVAEAYQTTDTRSTRQESLADSAVDPSPQD